MNEMAFLRSILTPVLRYSYTFSTYNPNGLEDQTAEHILQRCPRLQTTRTNAWPTAVQLHTKLGYGSREELEKTDTFTDLADWTLSVAAIEMKKKKKTIQMFMVAANKCIFKYDFRLVFVLVSFIEKILSSL